MTRTFAREMTPAEQRGALLRRLYERLGVDQVPPQPSKQAGAPPTVNRSSS